RLARAVGAEEREHLAGGDLNRQLVHGDEIAERLGEPARPHRRLNGHQSSVLWKRLVLSAKTASPNSASGSASVQSTSRPTPFRMIPRRIRRKYVSGMSRPISRIPAGMASRANTNPDRM